MPGKDASDEEAIILPRSIDRRRDRDDLNLRRRERKGRGEIIKQFRCFDAELSAMHESQPINMRAWINHEKKPRRGDGSASGGGGEDEIFSPSKSLLICFRRFAMTFCRSMKDRLSLVWISYGSVRGVSKLNGKTWTLMTLLQIICQKCTKEIRDISAITWRKKRKYRRKKFGNGGFDSFYRVGSDMERTIN